MAYEGVEVEIKLRVDQPSAAAVVRLLAASSARESRQVDAYFDRRGESFLRASPVREWLSVRSRGEAMLINHKLFHFGDDGRATHCDEVDVKVDSAKSAERLLTALGYEPLITVDKRRLEARIDDIYEVSVDHVVGLGQFVEIEAASRLGSVLQTKRALEQFAVRRLGLDLDVVDHKGYPHLLLEQAGRLPDMR